jgi:signal transduction histidine kinase
MNIPAIAEPIDEQTGASLRAGEVDLAAVLEAWQTATDRLQCTHAALRDEVCRLSDELERKNRELARKNRLADLGLVASHVAHEVRNSLVPMKLYLSLLRRQLAADVAVAALLDKFTTSLTALEATVADLLHFSADRQPQRRQFPACELIDDVCAALEPQFAAQRIELVVTADPELVFDADYDMLRRALLNLVLNALDVLPHGGRLLVEAAAFAETVQLSVADTGPGIDAQALDRVFEPFFSTKCGGTGLGLAVVARIAEAHGGAVTAENGAHVQRADAGFAGVQRGEGGAVFRLRLPQRNREVA